MSVFSSTAQGSMPRINWRVERNRIDLASVATALMGPPPGRGRDQGLWWVCRFHGDNNPSLQVDPDRQRWRCFGCDAKGDAADLVMRLENLTFREAIRRLMGGDLGPTMYHSTPTPRPARPVGPSGLSASQAVALVADAQARIWTPEGAGALAYLTADRHLTEATIRAARLGWTPGVRLPRSAGGYWTARGWTIPWFDGDRLTKVNIRQLDGSIPKYAEAFRDGPSVFSGTFGTTRPGVPLIVTEGEFDALLLGQELADLAMVVSLGSASNRPNLAFLDRLGRYHPWHTAHDNDGAGDTAAAEWPARSRRVRPPIGKDWTEAKQRGIDLRRWWTDRLGGIANPEAFPWHDLAALRWGPGIDDPEPGIIIDQPDRTRLRVAFESLGIGPGDAFEPQTGETP